MLIKISWVVSLVMGILNVISSTGARIVAHVYTTAIIVAVPILYGAIFNEARALGVVLVTTLLCLLPVILLSAFTAGQEADGTISKVMLRCFTATCANSCINPFIYYYKFHSLRRNIRKLFHRVSHNISRHDTTKVYPSHDPCRLETFPRTAWNDRVKGLERNLIE